MFQGGFLGFRKVSEVMEVSEISGWFLRFCGGFFTFLGGFRKVSEVSGWFLRFQGGF